MCGFVSKIVELILDYSNDRYIYKMRNIVCKISIDHMSS